MLKSMINPDPSGRKTKLTLGIMLIMLLAMSSMVLAQGTEPVDTDGDSKLEIDDKPNLLYLSENSAANWSADYEQTTNITFTDADFLVDGDFYNGGAGFSPIGNSLTKFTGSYDGYDENGSYTIDNLYINRPGDTYVGLFGYTSNATVTDLGATNVEINGLMYVGGLVGENNSSTVSNSYSTGSVNGGNDYVGGLVGENNSSTVRNSYSTGSVTGGNGYVGGLVGYNNGGASISNSYSTGSVSGTLWIEGLVGHEDHSSDVSNSFWNETLGPPDNGIGTGKTTTQMTTDALVYDYTDNIYLAAGWDFKGETTNGTDDIWNIGNGRNSGYPYFDWEYPSDPATLPVILSTFTAQYVNNKAQLYWRTQTETDNIGWNVYRANSNDFSTSEQINGSLIEGNGTTAEPSYYSFADESELTIGQTYYYWLESIDLGGENHIYNTVVNVTIPEPGNDPNLELPTLYKIRTAPNPMQDGTKFKLTMDKTAKVKIEIYNIKGELVKTFPSIIVEADAEQDLYWNGKDSNSGVVGSGLYFYKVKANGKTIENNKLIIMK